MIDKIKEELGKVFYPGKTDSVIKEGVIGNISIEEGIVSIELMMKEDNANAVQILQKSIPNAVGKIEGVKDVNIIINLPKHDEEPPKLENIRYILASTSGKGGVGKSTVSVNLAISLSKFGYKVGLLDADIYGPNIPRMMGIDGIPVALDPKNKDKILPIVKYGIKIISIGSMIPKDAAVIWRGPLINQVIKQFLNDVTWG
ncbi:MAG: P-loop NTPase, partial [Desulfurella sp.]